MKPKYCPTCGQQLDKKDVIEQSDGFMVWYIVHCGHCQIKLRIKIKEV